MVFFFFVFFLLLLSFLFLFWRGGVGGGGGGCFVNFKSRSSEKFKGCLFITYCVLMECIFALLLCMKRYV